MYSLQNVEIPLEIPLGISQKTPGINSEICPRIALKISPEI